MLIECLVANGVSQGLLAVALARVVSCLIIACHIMSRHISYQSIDSRCIPKPLSRVFGNQRRARLEAPSAVQPNGEEQWAGVDLGEAGGWHSSRAHFFSASGV